MAAVVHHGGAGLRAGIPNIIAPFGGDQYAWANLVVKLGIGLQVGGVQELTAEKLAKAIDISINDSGMRSRAAVMGEKIRAEDGISRAVEVLERHMVQNHRAA